MNYKIKRVSKEDIVTKYIYDYKGHNIEYVYIDNLTGKDIICVPSQTGCNLACSFCYLTYRKDKEVLQIDSNFTISCIQEIISECKNIKHDTLLISFMGSGEPLLNPIYINDVLTRIIGNTNYSHIRGGLSTIIPSEKSITEIIDLVKFNDLPLKLHWSLHHTINSQRKIYMPKAMDIFPSALQVNKYREETGNPIEVHYTLFEGNSTIENADHLGNLLSYFEFPLKILKFRERPDRLLISSETEQQFIYILKNDYNIPVEEYTPPGNDVLSACGLFEIG